MEKQFYFNHDTCKTCNICMEICPAFVIGKDEDGKMMFKPDYKELCLECGQCMAVCNTKSVFASDLSYEKDFFEFEETDAFNTILQQRRSVRRFKPKQVGQEEIDKILEAIKLVPHGDAHHHVEVTVINNREKIMEGLPIMVKFYAKLQKWLHNPFMKMIIKMKKGKSTINTLTNHLLPRIEKGIYNDFTNDYDGITRGAQTILIFHAPKDSEEHVEDAYIMVTYATLAAKNLGLGSTIIGLVPAALNKTPELRELFKIPHHHNTVVSLIVGYPKYKYWRGVKRELKNVTWVN